MTDINDSGDLLGGSDDAGFFGSGEQSVDLFGEAPVIKEETPPAASTGNNLARESISVVPAPTGPVSKPQSDGYVVLARKYRPQTFDDIVGQQGVQQGLRGAIATGQISHAYLFSGPRGTGKTSTARILAKALNCQENGPRPDPCGRCSSCRSITAGSSLDVIEIDAASNTGVDNIRELKSGIVLAPFSKYKVYIVDEVHMLSNQAFNALLKTLEEPPPQVIFVLATTELHKVPETIISRCSTFMFRRFSLDELKGQLGNILDIEVEQRGLSVDPDDREKILDLISRNAEGGMRDAQVTLDQVLVLGRGKLDFDSVRRFLGMADVESLGLFVTFLGERNSQEILQLIDTLVAQGQDLELFVKGVCEYLRDLLLVKCAGRDTSLINVSQDRAQELEAAANRFPAAFMINTIDHFMKVVGEMKTSGQPRTVLELAVLKLTLLDAAADINSIIKRLDALEASGGQGPTPRNSVAESLAPTNVAQRAAQQPNDNYISKSGDALAAVRPEEQSSTAGVSFENAHEPKGSVSEVTAQHAVTDADSGMQKLCAGLSSESSMLFMSFEKALVGFDYNGTVLILKINSSQKLAAMQVMRPQSSATITKVAHAAFGANILVKFELQEVGNTPSSQPAPHTPVQIPPSAEVSTLSETQDMDLVDSSVIGSPDEAELKIYYPEEIREKTMLEVKSAEFEMLMATDSHLKELVEKTKEVFGIDKSRVKFHRSTLA